MHNLCESVVNYVEVCTRRMTDENKFTYVGKIK